MFCRDFPVFLKVTSTPYEQPYVSPEKYASPLAYFSVGLRRDPTWVDELRELLGPRKKWKNQIRA